jgi:hypothetical protein
LEKCFYFLGPCKYTSKSRNDGWLIKIHKVFPWDYFTCWISGNAGSPHAQLVAFTHLPFILPPSESSAVNRKILLAPGLI